MRRSLVWSGLVVCAALLAPVVRADVKTHQKSTVKFEGLMGSFINRMAGGANGIMSAIAVQGNRMSRMTDNRGEIVDLGEQKVYTVDLKKKEYTVQTFDQLRQALQAARADMAKQSSAQDAQDAKDRQAAEDAAKQIEFDVDVHETGQHKPMVGADAREVVMTITMRQKGQKLEDSGGMVMTDTMWITPKIAALDEVNAFNQKYFRAIFGDSFGQIEAGQMNALSAMLPNFAALGNRLSVESSKLQGTPVAATMVIETVKSKEQMQAAGNGSDDQSSSPSGRLGGMLARRMMRRNTDQRTKTVTITHETLDVSPTVATADVQIPAGFKEKTN
jgi:hypothetical protein